MDALTPPQVTEYFIALGQTKARQAYLVTFFKSWQAGWMLGFGAMLVQLIQAGSPTLKADNPALLTLIAAFFFPVGLLMLVLTGNELLTAHLMFMPMAALRGKIKVWAVLVNWLIVLFGNLAGALCYVAFMAHYSGLYTPALQTFSQTVAVAKTSEGWAACVLRSIGCNFLVCTAVWLGASAREVSSKILAIHFPTMLFVFLGFEHVIVNMYYIPMGMLNGADVSAARYIAQSLVPSFIGNLIGGCLLGIPMVLFHAPPELDLPLPLFLRARPKQGDEEEDVVKRDGEAAVSREGSTRTL
ncbi:uncharacterized protein EHS24_005735 [Apiotrichum porosum]|uniref:Formate/nitrite transporter n=1 Tax=Apiotrichum porosum TaxID=105984 RepID=A0A427XZB3_9TREE|nr:uncharacterized protein EHS24_005735 [Apiotrichum porosum]RSH84226.1 hypothetical protein EHS24_005735 [Apiotrichum porosum]